MIVGGGGRAGDCVGGNTGGGKGAFSATGWGRRRRSFFGDGVGGGGGSGGGGNIKILKGMNKDKRMIHREEIERTNLNSHFTLGGERSRTAVERGARG